MVAFLGILVGENWNPLFEQQISGPAIYQFQEADALNTYLWVFVLFGVALVEGINDAVYLRIQHEKGFHNFVYMSHETQINTASKA
jgi:hypothetical protein